MQFAPGTWQTVAGPAATEPDAPWYVKPWDPAHPKAGREGGSHDETLAFMKLAIASRSEVGTKPGPRPFLLEQETRGALSKPGRANLARVGDIGESAVDFELVVDREDVSTRQLDGRFYAYDYGKRAVVCAADLHVTLPDAPPATPEIVTRSNLRGAALEQQANRFFVAGPPR